ncbi:MAG: hypothetical protein VX778_00645, partial [Candidatus Thermoplasmatota archaeon]|nr:hypothetical protein [Candidatus Thermoplasmatota archaeon]
MSKRVLFVSILLIFVGLSGCLGESTSSGSSQSNIQLINLEVINDCEHAEVNIQSTTLANGSTIDTVLGINVSVYHAIYTPDVSGLVFGYDTNLDGTIDVFDNSTKGINNLSIPISEFETLDGNFYLTSIAGIATVSGGITTQLVHVSNDCESLSGINFAQLTYFSGLYDFRVTDASGTPGTDGGDALVYIAMDNGDDLSWASVIVQMSADDGVYTTCTNPNEAVDTGCAVGDNDDGSWTFGEEVTVSEGTDSICDGPCSVQVKVLDRSSNKLIYESTV